jgi:hypothetical protein
MEIPRGEGTEIELNYTPTEIRGKNLMRSRESDQRARFSPLFPTREAGSCGVFLPRVSRRSSLILLGVCPTINWEKRRNRFPEREGNESYV